MSNPMHCGRRRPLALLSMAALALGTLLQATCNVQVPGVSLNIDQRLLQIKTPTVTVDTQTGQLEVNGSPIRYGLGQ